ncbi:hypothetical protein GCM10027432_26230 [Lysobacter fragariae]
MIVSAAMVPVADAGATNDGECAQAERNAQASSTLREGRESVIFIATGME